MSSKNPEKSLQGSESHLFWHEYGKGNKTQAAQAIDEDEEDVLFFWSSCASKNCVFEQENISPAIRYCLPPLQFLQAQT